MVQAILRPRARLTERQHFWLDPLRVCREQGQTLKGDAQAHGLSSVSGLYTAHSTLEHLGLLNEPGASAPRFVPMCIAAPSAACRVHLPNIVVVEVPTHAEGTVCATVLECASRLP